MEPMMVACTGVINRNPAHAPTGMRKNLSFVIFSPPEKSPFG
jgi:hypothetical protein